MEDRYVGKQLLGLVSSSAPSGERRVTIPTIHVSIANKRVEKSFNYYETGWSRRAGGYSAQGRVLSPLLSLQLPSQALSLVTSTA